MTGFAFFRIEKKVDKITMNQVHWWGTIIIGKTTTHTARQHSPTSSGCEDQNLITWTSKSSLIFYGFFIISMDFYGFLSPKKCMLYMSSMVICLPVETHRKMRMRKNGAPPAPPQLLQLSSYPFHIDFSKEKRKKKIEVAIMPAKLSLTQTFLAYPSITSLRMKTFFKKNLAAPCDENVLPLAPYCFH